MMIEHNYSQNPQTIKHWFITVQRAHDNKPQSLFLLMTVLPVASLVGLTATWCCNDLGATHLIAN